MTYTTCMCTEYIERFVLTNDRVVFEKQYKLAYHQKCYKIKLFYSVMCSVYKPAQISMSIKNGIKLCYFNGIYGASLYTTSLDLLSLVVLLILSNLMVAWLCKLCDSLSLSLSLSLSFSLARSIHVAIVKANCNIT